jgi:hypothetical protein
MSFQLDVAKYNFQELLAILELSLPLTEENMKQAKKMVLMKHPDKSHLPPEYYIFYKQAYRIILDIYKEQNKIAENQTASMDYNADAGFEKNELVEQNAGKINNTEFNSLFETHIIQKKDDHMNWNDASEYEHYELPPESKSVNDIFKNMKKTHALIPVKTKEMSSWAGQSVYGDSEDPTDYISCDPFSKFKFEDVRKVHRDAPIYLVDDAEEIQPRTWDKKLDITHKTYEENLQILEEQNSNKQLKFMNNLYGHHQENLKNEAKINGFLSSLFMIKNDK